MEDQDGNIMINNKCLQFDTGLKTNTQNNLRVTDVSAKGNNIDSSSKMLINSMVFFFCKQKNTF